MTTIKTITTTAVATKATTTKIKTRDPPDSKECRFFSGRARLGLHLEGVDVAETEDGGSDAPGQAGDGTDGHHEADDQHVQVVAASFLKRFNKHG